ncbi:ferrous iron transport protein A [Zavarzinia sp.]|uniref:FeoA family protein n=1 Tax=Zavarzinia sp. TaxID=2027920 RepID=UPI003562F449
MSQVALFEIQDGEVRVARHGGEAEQRRLADLGLRPGARVTVLRHNGEGGLMLSVNDTRLAIDAATARSVMVDRLEAEFPPLTLAGLAPGERARVTALGRDKGKGDYRRRLMAMGLTPGVSFEITRVAPLGDPVEIRVRGYAMSLRRAEADLVVVEKLP